MYYNGLYTHFEKFRHCLCTECFENVCIPTCFYNYIVFSFQNIHPDKEILVDIIVFLWQKCKTGLQRIQMCGSDYLKSMHKHKAYQVLIYYNVFLLISMQSVIAMQR